MSLEWAYYIVIRKLRRKNSMTRVLIRIVFALILSVAVLLGGLLLASESGEVVVLTTTSDDGPVQSRTWIIDHMNSQWLRGSPASGWVRRISENPTLSMERKGQSASYIATFIAEEISTINRLSKEKYGWADLYVRTIFPVADGVAIRLDPVGE